MTFKATTQEENNEGLKTACTERYDKDDDDGGDDDSASQATDTGQFTKRCGQALTFYL